MNQKHEFKLVEKVKITDRKVKPMNIFHVPINNKNIEKKF
jgi:hypothetical protein